MITAGSGREFVFQITGDSSGLDAAAKQGSAALKGTADTTAALDRAQKGAADSSDNLAGRLAAVGTGAIGLGVVVRTAFEGARALTEAQIAADRLMSQLGASVGAARAGQELAYVRKTANELGLEVDSTAQAYARFMAAGRGTSMEGQAQREIFEAVAKSAAVMGSSADETTGILRALEQMMSKGVVMSEEFKGQLGERLPGALQVGARAMNVTTGELMKMMEAGELISADFLPKFARQLELEMGTASEQAADRMGAATQRVSNAYDLMKQDVAASGFGDFIKGQLNIAADGLGNVSERMQAARVEGGGFASQMVAAGAAVLQFLNPFNALIYSAGTAAGELQQAKAKVAELKAEMERGSGNIFLRPKIQELEEFIAKAELARQKTVNLRAIDNDTMQRYERGNEEEAARRRARLKGITAELNGETGKLAKTLKDLAASYAAGDITGGESEYERLVQKAVSKFGGSTGRAAPKPRQGNAIEDAEREVQKRIERWREQNENALDRNDERDGEAYNREVARRAADEQRNLDMSLRMREQLGIATAQTNAGMIRDDRARGEAVLAIERAQLTSRMDLLALDGAARKRHQDDIDAYMLARETQLTEELKPEWQRRLEAWADLQTDMQDRFDTFSDGFIDRGRDMFDEFLRTGKVNTRSLTDFIRSEFARMAYERFLAQTVRSFGSQLFDAFFGGGSGVPIAGEFQTGLPMPGFDRPGEGLATGTNYVPRDMVTLIHEGEAVVPKKYNPAAGGAGPGGGVTINNFYTVAPGVSRAEMAMAAEQTHAASVATIADMMARGNRALLPV